MNILGAARALPSLCGDASSATSGKAAVAEAAGQARRRVVLVDTATCQGFAQNVGRSYITEEALTLPEEGSARRSCRGSGKYV